MQLRLFAPNPIECLTDAFCKMDMREIKYLLSDYKSFDNINKDVLLEKLEWNFNEFKKAGDYFLVPLDGYCSGCECNASGKAGFRFVGNVSYRYNDFVFMYEQDIFKDVTQCNAFCCFKTALAEAENNAKVGPPMVWFNTIRPNAELSDILLYKQPIQYYFYDNEYNTYKGSTHDILAEAQCKEQYYKFINNKRILDGPYLKSWVTLMADLDRKLLFLFNLKYVAKFSSLYRTMKGLSSMIANNTKCRAALEEFKTFIYGETLGVPELIAWLCKYEELYKETDIYTEKDVDFNKQSPLLDWYDWDLHSFKQDCFEAHIFNCIFNQYQYKLFYTYTTKDGLFHSNTNGGSLKITIQNKFAAIKHNVTWIVDEYEMIYTLEDLKDATNNYFKSNQRVNPWEAIKAQCESAMHELSQVRGRMCLADLIPLVDKYKPLYEAVKPASILYEFSPFYLLYQSLCYIKNYLAFKPIAMKANRFLLDIKHQSNEKFLLKLLLTYEPLYLQEFYFYLKVVKPYSGRVVLPRSNETIFLDESETKPVDDFISHYEKHYIRLYNKLKVYAAAVDLLPAWDLGEEWG